MSVDQKLALKCKLRDRPNPDGRGFVLPTGTGVMGYHLMRVITTDDTPTLMVDTDTGLEYIELRDNSLYTMRFDLLGVQTGGTDGTVGDSSLTIGCGAVKRLDGASTATVVDYNWNWYYDGGTGSWDMDVDADTTNGGVSCTVYGDVDKTVLWELAIYLEIGMKIEA